MTEREMRDMAEINGHGDMAASVKEAEGSGRACMGCIVWEHRVACMDILIDRLRAEVRKLNCELDAMLKVREQ